jgi:beta-glucosidase
VSQYKIYKFPRGFLWGAATSSHQVEGNNRWNDWWEYEQSERLPHKSGEACRHYECFEQDFDLAHSWGHNAHRFSIEWSRIEPSEGNWNIEVLAHYRDVIRALRERALEPIVTLHHFTNPTWFSRSGGWLRSDSATVFARYVEYMVTNLGAEVKYWLTVNEPTVYVAQGYISGEWPPFVKSDWIKAAIAFRNLARAHVCAYRLLHKNRPDVMVSFAHNVSLTMPCNPRRKTDRIAARMRDSILNGAFFHLIGTRRRHLRQATGTLDFMGLNYYKRTIVHSHGWGLEAILGRTCQPTHHRDQGPVSAMGWEVYPRGLKTVLEKFSRFGLPLLVTENGIATDDEFLRRDFLLKHLQSLADALDNGVNVIGYLYWSLIDNFEWALGTEPRFGLAAVEYNTQQRSPRALVEDFARVCRENRLIYTR